MKKDKVFEILKKDGDGALVYLFRQSRVPHILVIRVQRCTCSVQGFVCFQYKTTSRAEDEELPRFDSVPLHPLVNK